LLVAIKEIVLELNADKTKYMIMSLDYNAGRSKYVQIDDSSFERRTLYNVWKQLKTNLNSIQRKLNVVEFR
jgi:hypothetical protein